MQNNLSSTAQKFIIALILLGCSSRGCCTFCAEVQYSDECHSKLGSFIFRVFHTHIWHVQVETFQ